MIGPAFLAFVIAAAITTSELVTTEYPRTYPFLAKSRSLWAYALIYALIAFGVTLALGAWWPPR